MQRFYTLNVNTARTSAANFGTHTIEEFRQINNFRVAGGIYDPSLSITYRSRQHDVLGAGVSRPVKMDCTAFHSAMRQNIATILLYLDPELRQTLQMKVYRPLAQRATARQGNLGFSRPTKQCSQREK